MRAENVPSGAANPPTAAPHPGGPSETLDRLAKEIIDHRTRDENGPSRCLLSKLFVVLEEVLQVRMRCFKARQVFRCTHELEVISQLADLLIGVLPADAQETDPGYSRDIRT